MSISTQGKIFFISVRKKGAVGGSAPELLVDWIRLIDFFRSQLKLPGKATCDIFGQN